MTPRSDLDRTPPPPTPAIQKAVCPVLDCAWESPEFEEDRTLHRRSKAIGMWRNHFLNEHTPHPEVITVRERGAPHV